jgi:ABC-type multidrug transport system ATPase subunit/pSer/pThr/pTyr-binding forkhead associated (FHA) protein
MEDKRRSGETDLSQARRPAAPGPAFLELRDDKTAGPRRIELNSEITRIGRDHGLEVVIAAAAAMVSRRHAEIRRQNGKYRLIDLDSFNGTFLNGRRLVGPALLSDGDRIELGPDGPALRFRGPSAPAPPPATGARTPAAGTPPRSAQRRYFDIKPQLTIGRGEDSDIRLDGLLISKHHARLLSDSVNLFVEDLGSTNGVYLNGARIDGRRALRPGDVIQIGPFLLQVEDRRVSVFDPRAKTRLDVLGVTKSVPDRSGRGEIRLLDGVSLTIMPNEFVGLLGPSGAGKSTLMDALNGMRPASGGRVLFNGLELYKHLDSLKQSIGYVPQDDIIHRELTVYRTLYYVARLRLSRDVTAAEIERTVAEVLDVTGLSERRDVPVSRLSGGQRKRVSIAVELITKPSVIFLDEPTSGLDPATEEKIMRLFRQIAESGRTVILTTHAMENVRLFDKIVVLMRGKLVFYGRPDEALRFVGAESFKDLYDKLEAPVVERLRFVMPGDDALKISEEVAEQWKRSFERTEQYSENVAKPLREVKQDDIPEAPAKRRATVTDALRQWRTLARRYAEVLSRDPFNLAILLGQAPLIALFTYLVVGAKAPRDFPYFVLALVAVWFGTSVAAREIIRERPIYNRERMVNLGLLPYVGSKLAVLSVIVSLQCVLLFGTLKLFDLTGLMPLPGTRYGATQLLVMMLTGAVGIALGLLISAVVKTSEMATSLVPLILIPQILFSGLVGVPAGASRLVGVVMPATWSFDELKRLSGLDVLRGKDEGAQPAGSDEGRGLYKEIEHENDRNIAEAQGKIDQYKADAEGSLKSFEDSMDQYQRGLLSGRPVNKPIPPKLGAAPEVAKAKKIPDDLSHFVDFLHPWGGRRLDLGIILLMFCGFTGATILTLRSQDIQ